MDRRGGFRPELDSPRTVVSRSWQDQDTHVRRGRLKVSSLRRAFPPPVGFTRLGTTPHASQVQHTTIGIAIAQWIEHPSDTQGGEVVADKFGETRKMVREMVMEIGRWKMIAKIHI